MAVDQSVKRDNYFQKIVETNGSNRFRYDRQPVVNANLKIFIREHNVEINNLREFYNLKSNKVYLG